MTTREGVLRRLNDFPLLPPFTSRVTDNMQFGLRAPRFSRTRSWPRSSLRAFLLPSSQSASSVSLFVARVVREILTTPFLSLRLVLGRARRQRSSQRTKQNEPSWLPRPRRNPQSRKNRGEVVRGRGRAQSHLRADRHRFRDRAGLPGVVVEAGAGVDRTVEATGQGQDQDRGPDPPLQNNLEVDRVGLDPPPALPLGLSPARSRPPPVAGRAIRGAYRGAVLGVVRGLLLRRDEERDQYPATRSTSTKGRGRERPSSGIREQTGGEEVRLFDTCAFVRRCRVAVGSGFTVRSSPL